MNCINQTPFNPEDPFDKWAHHFKGEVTEVFERARADPSFDLEPGEDLASFIMGGLTAIIGVTFVMTVRDGRDALVGGIVDAIPQARAVAESIIDDEGEDDGPLFGKGRV